VFHLREMNIRATIWRAWRFFLQTFWVGKHGSDYSLSCTEGDCASSSAGCTKQGQTCKTGADCAGTCGTTGSCGCPDPLAHSTKTSNCSTSCSSLKIGTCLKCTSSKCANSCALLSFCADYGGCGFTCDTGYVWNGSSCVLASAGKSWGTIFMFFPKIEFPKFPRLKAFLRRRS
jgi:hypothetical protein